MSSTAARSTATIRATRPTTRQTRSRWSARQVGHFPETTMTLTDLTPDGVRDEVLHLLADHLAHYAVALSPLDSPQVFAPPGVEIM